MNRKGKQEKTGRMDLQYLRKKTERNLWKAGIT